MLIVEKIKALEALPYVIRAIEIKADHLTVLAIEPSLEDYAEIDEIADDTDVEVCPLVETSTENFPLFVSEQNYHEWRNIDNGIRIAGEAKLLQHEFKLDFEPRTNVLLGDDIGLLFGSVQDKFRYSELRQRK